MLDYSSIYTPLLRSLDWPLQLFHCLLLFNFTFTNIVNEGKIHAILFLFQIPFTLFLLVFYPFARLLQSICHFLNPPKPLSPTSVAHLTPYFSPSHLSRLRVIHGDSLLSKIESWMGSFTAAFTLEEYIYFPSSSNYREGSSKLHRLLRHEIVHSLQFQNVRIVAFLGLYFAYLIVNPAFLKLTPQQTYRQIPVEREAYDLEEKKLLSRNAPYTSEKVEGWYYAK